MHSFVVAAGKHNGALVFVTGFRLFAHQGVGIGDAQFGAKGWINANTLPVLLERGIEFSGHAQNLGVRIVRVGLIWLQCDIALHHGGGFREVTNKGVVVGQLVQCCRIVRVQGQSAFQGGNGLLIAGLAAQPSARDVE